MRRSLITLVLLFVFLIAQSQKPTPRQLFPGLFEAVQLTSIFPDNKLFVDATANRAPGLIMKDYNEQKNKPDFNLKQFVADNFFIPGTHNDVFKSNVSAGVRKHIDTLWQVLYRKHDTVSKYSSLLALPHDFIVPGGRFRETIKSSRHLIFSINL